MSNCKVVPFRETFFVTVVSKQGVEAIRRNHAIGLLEQELVRIVLVPFHLAVVTFHTVLELVEGSPCHLVNFGLVKLHENAVEGLVDLGFVEQYEVLGYWSSHVVRVLGRVFVAGQLVDTAKDTLGHTLV